MISGYIDRLEEGRAVILLEDEYQVLFPEELLGKAQEGDYISIDIKVDKEKNQQVLNEVLDLMDD